MYDEEEDTSERSRSPPSRREAEAERKHINHRQHGVNPNSEEGRAERQRRERAERYERRARQRAEGLDVSRSPSPSQTNDNLDRPSPYEYENINREEQGDTVTPLGTFETYNREGIPRNINFGQDTQESIIENENSTTTQSEEPTSRQVNQAFEEFLQQVRASEQAFNYRVPINSTTSSGHSGGGRGSGTIAMSGGAPPPPRRGKIPLPTYKGKKDPDTYIQEYVNICHANQEGTDAEKLRLFPVTLKKKALEWYTQFPANHFMNWNDLKTTFIQRFRSTKSEGEIINNLSHVKQKKDESVEEFYERVMVAAAKIQPAPGEQIRKTWFINGLRKEYEKYVNILPSDTLEEALASARKIEMSKTKKERMKEDESSGDSSSDSDDDGRRTQKGKAKKADITKDDLKALKREIEELAIGTRKFRTGVTCQKCRNEGHYSNECQLKSCSNCNSTT